MAERLTQEEMRQREGMAFFEAEGRLERVMNLISSHVSSVDDEIWVSAHDRGAGAVVGATLFGARVIVTASIPAGRIRLWSGVKRRFFDG